MKAFGGRIKEARIKKGLTQKQLASLIGAKHNSVSDWENNKNKPDPDTIELLMGALEIDANTLFGWDDKEQLKQDAIDLTNKIENNANINTAMQNIGRLSEKNQELVYNFIEMLIKNQSTKGGDDNAD